MSKTLGQLRASTRGLLREDSGNSHFTDSVINGVLNEGVEFSAVFIEYPRDLVSVQAQDGVGAYPNPADNLLLRSAYFGNRDTITSDIRPLTFVTEETLKAMYPSWLDQTSGSTADRPQYIIQLDRNTIYVYPRPNGVGSAQGKKIWLNYNYVPAPMTDDSDVPDLPAPYHSLLPIYAMHLLYIPLEKDEKAPNYFDMFMKKINLLKSAVTKESKENLGFAWGMNEGFDSGSGVEF